jgi:hypothetical protein
MTHLCQASSLKTGLCPEQAAGWFEGGCVHEHVTGGWLCAGHAADQHGVLCLECLDGPQPHVCPMVIRETAAVREGPRGAGGQPP